MGQYIMYHAILDRTEADRELYLAIRKRVYFDLFEEPIGGLLLDTQQIRLLIFDPKKKEIFKWIPEVNIVRLYKMFAQLEKSPATAACSNQPPAFEAVASEYDKNEAGNPILQWMRARVQQEALAYFPPGARILEIGCGTGTDALYFAKNGFQMNAVEPSGEMLQIARQKITAAGLADSVNFVQGHVENLHRLFPRELFESFDAIFSNFGALNCIASLKYFAEAAANLLKPNGTILLNIMPPVCPWEIFYFLTKRQPKKALRRWRGRPGTGGVDVNVGDRTIRAYYHSAKQIKKAFAENFRLAKQFSLGLLVPPPFLKHSVANTSLFQILAKAENQLAGWPVLRKTGDHFVLIFRKKV